MNRLLPCFVMLAALALAGCDGSEKPMSKDEAKDKIFAPTDLDKMTPEMRAKVPANGMGPAGSSGGGGSATPPANLPGANPPPGATPPTGATR
ncbi:MAG: hypothetical protein SFX74_12585 [Fimbriimonadaceae bacterium]|nr:hypothetical protein [Fimbriimonadaceae bacterium]